MIVLLNFDCSSINDDIVHQLAWKGRISGLAAEKMLRGKKTPFLYILRAGELESENEKDYYITFIQKDFTIKHQPFVITINPEGWYYENGCGGGPFIHTTSITDVLHLIMHAPKDAPQPMIS